MDQNEFKAKLKELFWKYEKKQLKKLDRIVEEFAGEEEAVIKHLHKRYRIHTPAAAVSPAPKVEEIETSEETDSVEELAEAPEAEDVENDAEVEDAAEDDDEEEKED